MNCNLELGWERVGIDSGEIVHVADNGEASSGRGAGGWVCNANYNR